MDNHSRYSKSELLRVALEADVQIYTILVDGAGGGSSGEGALFRPSMIAKPGAQAAERQGPSLLEELAEKTGGLSFHARSEAQAQEAMLKASQALRNQYVIGYIRPRRFRTLRNLAPDSSQVDGSEAKRSCA